MCCEMEDGGMVEVNGQGFELIGNLLEGIGALLDGIESFFVR